ncbi:MAG: glycosyltransferase family 2 protein, partial [Candidatus Competibacteraceae bacterium]|nr:glycosyltransferase family 2 protein [Candidatus Competibacteraceae bacterium]
MPQTEPDFSIVIPSRNRPALLRAAVASVIAQTHLSREIIIVNDGSDPEHQTAYQELIENAAETIRLIHLPRTPNGHGPSYAINRGVEQA